MAVALALPYSPLAALLGFVPLPAGYFLFLMGATGGIGPWGSMTLQSAPL